MELLCKCESTASMYPLLRLHPNLLYFLTFVYACTTKGTEAIVLCIDWLTHRPPPLFWHSLLLDTTIIVLHCAVLHCAAPPRPSSSGYFLYIVKQVRVKGPYLCMYCVWIG